MRPALGGRIFRFGWVILASCLACAAEREPSPSALAWWNDLRSRIVVSAKKSRKIPRMESRLDLPSVAERLNGFLPLFVDADGDGKLDVPEEMVRRGFSPEVPSAKRQYQAILGELAAAGFSVPDLSREIDASTSGGYPALGKLFGDFRVWSLGGVNYLLQPSSRHNAIPLGSADGELDFEKFSGGVLRVFDLSAPTHGIVARYSQVEVSDFDFARNELISFAVKDPGSSPEALLSYEHEDIDGDGHAELVYWELIYDLKWPVIFRWKEGKWREESVAFPEFYSGIDLGKALKTGDEGQLAIVDKAFFQDFEKQLPDRNKRRDDLLALRAFMSRHP